MVSPIPPGKCHPNGHSYQADQRDLPREWAVGNPLHLALIFRSQDTNGAGMRSHDSACVRLRFLDVGKNPAGLFRLRTGPGCLLAHRCSRLEVHTKQGYLMWFHFRGPRFVRKRRTRGRVTQHDVVHGGDWGVINADYSRRHERSIFQRFRPLLEISDDKGDSGSPSI